MGVLDPVAVGKQRFRPPRGIVGGSRAERDLVQIGERFRALVASRALVAGAIAAGGATGTVGGRGATEDGDGAIGWRPEGKADAGEGILAVERGEVGDQKAAPCGPLQILRGERSDLGVEVGGCRA